jgi:CelD/BcsL family acetyltransferase involved in cellulose biosynthesis
LNRDDTPDDVGYLARLARPARKELQRHLRRAQDSGISVAVVAPDVAPLPELVALVVRTATRVGSPNYYNPTRLTEFLAALGAPVRIVELRSATGRLLGVSVCFLDHNTVWCWALGYERDDSLSFSPYYVLWWQMLNIFWESGTEVAEFGRMNDHFKAKMGLTRRASVAALAMSSG